LLSGLLYCCLCPCPSRRECSTTPNLFAVSRSVDSSRLRPKVCWLTSLWHDSVTRTYTSACTESHRVKNLGRPSVPFHCAKSVLLLALLPSRPAIESAVCSLFSCPQRFAARLGSDLKWEGRLEGSVEELRRWRKRGKCFESCGSRWIVRG
jgi:hypothetical protein